MTAPDPASRLVTVNPFRFGIDDVDAVLTFRNLHNFTAEGRRSVAGNTDRFTFLFRKPDRD